MDISKIIAMTITFFPIAWFIYFVAYYRGYNYRSKIIENEWEIIQNFKEAYQKLIENKKRMPHNIHKEYGGG